MSAWRQAGLSAARGERRAEAGQGVQSALGFRAQCGCVAGFPVTRLCVVVPGSRPFLTVSTNTALAGHPGLPLT